MQDLRNPWLVAVWPGMGRVAQIAGSYLVARLGMQPLAELEPDGFFEPSGIHVKEGLLQPGRLPRSVFHAFRDPAGMRDLVVMVGEKQPATGAVRYAGALLDTVARHRIERVVTFAAMATAMHPRGEPRVFAACTTPALCAEVRAAHDGLALLDEAEITGMNGLFLAAAQQRGIPALGLLGEVPAIAAGMPSPKAAEAVLRVLGRLAGLRFDLEQLAAEGRRIQQWLLQQVEGRQEQEAEVPPPREGRAATAAAPRAGPRVPPEVLQRIESLFTLARGDREKALELKAELDRHGLFRAYEDRFLDLFKQGS
jgi:hypothetical protein